MLSIKNVNYKARVAPGQLKIVDYTEIHGCCPPHQKIIKIAHGAKMVIFPSGKCRIMGLKRVLDFALPIRVTNLELQSITVVFDLGQMVNLRKLATQVLPRGSFVYEPELFPALRLTSFNPMCVNVFSTEKIVILGLRKFKCNDLIGQILNLLQVYKRENAQELTLFTENGATDSTTQLPSDSNWRREISSSLKLPVRQDGVFPLDAKHTPHRQ